VNSEARCMWNYTLCNK